MNSKQCNINKQIGIKLRIERFKKRLSQEKLAEFANLNRDTIGSIERAEISPTIETLYQISQALGLELHDFVNVTKIDV